ncbi:MAG TPA: protein phosphatase 2C domain-containing protein [Woeseiaceae bacterium]|nr:protein phosphatase 2C domain-containing protein [Woeseiaceae bacterium]
MAESPDEMVLLDGDDVPELVYARVAGGAVAAYTSRAPDKTTANEDSVAVIPYGPGAAVFAVADGAGGLPAGRRASRMAINSLDESLQDSMQKTTLLRTAILNGIEAANLAVLEMGMGAATTLTVVTIEGSLLRTYHIGDSEAIVVGQRGVIKSQTMAHSPTGFAVEAGFLDLKDALHHEERHLVSNFLGTSDMRIDMGAEVQMRPRDTVLLASDGLTDNLHTHEITAMIRKGPLPDVMDSLISLAKRRMTVESTHQPSKPDDLSIIVFRKPYKARLPVQPK